MSPLLCFSPRVLSAAGATARVANSSALFRGGRERGLPQAIDLAVALMGKDNFDRIWAGAMRLLKTLKPAGGVGKRRYTIGLYMLVVPTLYAWIASYAPSWLPEDYVLRVWVNLGLDLVTLASLFVLGGDFWDKVRALFLHDARVVSPS